MLICSCISTSFAGHHPCLRGIRFKVFQSCNLTQVRERGVGIVNGVVKSWRFFAYWAPVSDRFPVIFNSEALKR